MFSNPLILPIQYNLVSNIKRICLSYFKNILKIKCVQTPFCDSILKIISSHIWLLKKYFIQIIVPFTLKKIVILQIMTRL